jgi:hypothetical protein
MTVADTRLQLIALRVNWGAHWDDGHSGVGILREQPRFGNSPHVTTSSPVEAFRTTVG